MLIFHGIYQWVFPTLGNKYTHLEFNCNLRSPRLPQVKSSCSNSHFPLCLLQVLPSAASRHGLRCWGFGVVLAFVANTCFATALQTSAHSAYLSGTILNFGITYYIHPVENIQGTSTHLLFLPARSLQWRHLASQLQLHRVEGQKSQIQNAFVSNLPEKSFLCVKTINYVNPTKVLGIYPFPDSAVYSGVNTACELKRCLTCII